MVLIVFSKLVKVLKTPDGSGTLIFFNKTGYSPEAFIRYSCN